MYKKKLKAKKQVQNLQVEMQDMIFLKKYLKKQVQIKLQQHII